MIKSEIESIAQDPTHDASLYAMTGSRVEIPQEEVDAIIRQKRKAREPKACYPCHQRKVKCDRNLPCDSCIKRDHADLCSYERPSKRRQIAMGSQFPENDYPSRLDSPNNIDPSLTSSGPTVTIPKEKWDGMCSDLRSMNESMSAMRQELQDLQSVYGPGEKGPRKSEETRSDEGEREGIHTETRQLGTVHLGSRSVLAYMMGLGRSKSTQDAAKVLLEESILPNLGLDNETATYPFVDLWSTDSSNQDVNGLLKLLPDDQHCIEFFTFYRDVACTIYPVIYDKNAFDNTMNLMLQNRARSNGVCVSTDAGPDRPLGVTISWIGLLFAVLASGCQSSRLGVKERELTSQVYVCCAYQALRMTNFMSQPSLEAIQTLLIIGNVLSYNMNPGCSYILLGMTSRMAFAMGLQSDSHRFSTIERWRRARVWWALAWQDSHFSMSYDRPSAISLHQPSIPYDTTSKPGQRSYAESMFQIISLTLEIIRNRSLTPRALVSYAVIQNYKDQVNRIVADGMPHLRDRNQCVVTTQHLERLALKLHASYITTELCRPCLKADRSDPIANSLRKDCIRGLERCITAYLETVNKICSLAARSWIGIQRAISAAFLLGVVEEAHQDARIISILRSLEAVMTERANLENTMFPGDIDAALLPPPNAGNGGGGIAAPPTLGQPGQSQPQSQSQSQPQQVVSPPPTTHPSVAGGGTGGMGSPEPGPGQQVPQSVHWARSMAKSLKALSKMNAALAGQHGTLAASGAAAGLRGGGGGGGGGGAGWGLPVTPESSGSSSGESWNLGNLGERAGEFVSKPLWGE